MAGRTELGVVQGGRTVRPRKAAAPRRRNTSVADAAKSGDDRQLLVALRDRIARDVDNVNTATRDLAALTRRLLEINREIKALDGDDEEGDGIEAATSAPDEKWPPR